MRWLSPCAGPAAGVDGRSSRSSWPWAMSSSPLSAEPDARLHSHAIGVARIAHSSVTVADLVGLADFLLPKRSDGYSRSARHTACHKRSNTSLKWPLLLCSSFAVCARSTLLSRDPSASCVSGSFSRRYFLRSISASATSCVSEPVLGRSPPRILRPQPSPARKSVRATGGLPIRIG
jgi:hypothetical protein